MPQSISSPSSASINSSPPHLRVVRDEDATPYDGQTKAERTAGGRFAMIPDAVFAVADAYAVAVYAVLARHADAHRESFPSAALIAQTLGISRPTVDRAIRKLIAAGVVVKERRYAQGMNTSNLYRLPKSPEPQCVTTLPTCVTTDELVGNVRSNGRQPRYAEQEPREQEPEEQETPPLPPKPSACDQRFERWYATYPKKKGKQAALKVWRRLKPDEAMTDQLVAAVLRQSVWNDWTKNAGQYIPNPATWLSQGRWEDEDRPVAANGHAGMSKAFATGRRVF